MGHGLWAVLSGYRLGCGMCWAVGWAVGCGLWAGLHFITTTYYILHPTPYGLWPANLQSGVIVAYGMGCTLCATLFTTLQSVLISQFGSLASQFCVLCTYCIRYSVLYTMYYEL
jgi:hypothetical protein